MKNHKLDRQKINRHFKVKIEGIFKKHKQDYNKLIGDLIKRKALDSGAAYKTIIDLYYSQIKALTDLYIESIFAAIDNEFYIDDDIKNEMLSLIQTFVAQNYGTKSAELRGRLANKNLLNSIFADSIFNIFNSEYHKILDIYKDKLIIAIDSYNKDYKLIQENKKVVKETKVDSVIKWLKNHWFFSIVIIIAIILSAIITFISKLSQLIEVIF